MYMVNRVNCMCICVAGILLFASKYPVKCKYICAKSLEEICIHVHVCVIIQESNADLPSEYWQIQKLIKYLRVNT